MLSKSKEQSSKKKSGGNISNTIPAGDSAIELCSLLFAL
jgi:hypothetical protein